MVVIKIQKSGYPTQYIKEYRQGYIELCDFTKDARIYMSDKQAKLDRLGIILEYRLSSATVVIEPLVGLIDVQKESSLPKKAWWHNALYALGLSRGDSEI